MQHFEGITRITTYFSDYKILWYRAICPSAGHFSNLTGWIKIYQTWTYLTLQCIGVRSAIWLISFQLLHIMTAPKLGMKQILIVMLAILFGSFLWKFNTKYWQLRLRYIFAHGHNLVSCRAKISQGLGVCHLSWTGSTPLLCILLVRSHVLNSNFYSCTFVV